MSNTKAELRAVVDSVLQQSDGMVEQFSNALRFGLAASLTAAMMDAKPVLIFVRRNMVDGTIEAIHPDSPEPIFEQANVVFQRMAGEAILAKRAKMQKPTIH